MSEKVVLEEVHHREVDLRFYKRSDGLYEVIGRLIDTKSHPFRRQLASEDTQPGMPLHDISVHLVMDADMLIVEASAHMDATPFDICPGATAALRRLEGLRIGGGWNKKVRELLGGAASCTHIVELLGPMATTAYQGLSPARLELMTTPDGAEQRKQKIDSCYAYGAQREVIARLWPELHKRPASSA